MLRIMLTFLLHGLTCGFWCLFWHWAYHRTISAKQTGEPEAECTCEFCRPKTVIADPTDPFLSFVKVNKLSIH